MSTPGMSPMGNTPPVAPAPTAAAQPQVHTMPDRFRTTGGPKGSGGTKKLIITLVVVLVVAGLAVAGLYVFNNVLTNANENTNTVVTNTTDENLNTTTNLNTNTELNQNTALNSNTDLNSNTSTTGNLNTNVALNTNTSTNTNTSVTPTVLPSSQDTDGDGLTDVEEAAYGTDINSSDSDADTFVDGRQTKTDGTLTGEVELGYNPKGTGTLEASTIVKRVTNSTKAYSVLIPAGWTTSADSNGGLLVTPSTTTGEFFQVRSTDNPTRLTPKDWYQQNNPSANVAALKTLTVNGLEGIVSEDSSTVYLFKDAVIYSIQYGTGSLTSVNYWTTFSMIQHSFKLGS